MDEWWDPRDCPTRAIAIDYVLINSMQQEHDDYHETKNRELSERVKFVLGLCVCLVGISAVADARADDFHSCTQETVAGTYGFSAQGIIGFGAHQAQAAETGMATADGTGNLSGNVTFSVNGTILQVPFTGTYQVNSDCTISEVIYFGTQVRHQAGVIVLNGNEIDFIDTDPGAILTRIAKRVGKD